MDETGITMKAFPRGNKDPQSHPSFQDEGLKIYCVTLNTQTLTHTQTAYVGNASA